MKKTSSIIFGLYLLSVFVVVFLSITIAIKIDGVMNKNTRQDISNNLTSVRDTTYISIKSALDNHKKWLAFANSAIVKDSTMNLLQLSQTPAVLIKSPSQDMLRGWFTDLQPTTEPYDYFIVTPDLFILASNIEHKIGLKKSQDATGDVLKKAFNGKAAISLPIRIRNKKNWQEQSFSALDVRLFIAAPIHDQFNKIVAVLMFSLKPENGFSNVLRQARIGQSGETYIFNREGNLLSESRFESQLNSNNVKPADQTNISEIKPQDYGANFIRDGYSRSGLVEKKLPLTYVVKTAIENSTGFTMNGTELPGIKMSGIDLIGHPDYRGVPVVAAWIWDDENDMGLVTTQETTEAYRTYSSSYLILTILLFVIILLMAGFAVFSYLAHFRKESRVLTGIEKSKAETYFNSVESIIVALDIEGNITDINRKGCDLLARNTDEMIGKNWFDICVPEDEREIVRDGFKRFIKGENQHFDFFENNIISKTGERIPVTWRNTFLIDLNGKVSGTLSVGIDVRERNEADEKLRESEVRFRMLVESIGKKFLIYRQTPDGKCQYISSACQQFTGVSSEKALGMRMKDLFKYTDDTLTKIKAFRKDIDNTKKDYKTYDGAYLHPDKTIHSIEITESCERDENGEAIAILGIMKDTIIENRLRQEATIFGNTDEGIIIANANADIILVNQAFSEISGYSFEEVVGKKILFQHAERHDANYINNIISQLEYVGQWRGQIWNNRKSGDVYPAWENITLVKDDNDKVINQVAIFSDITLLKQSEDRLTHQAHHDSLTGLPNRLRFFANMEQSLLTAIRHQHKVALMFVDLDRFKLINDTKGHNIGDEVLKVVAERLIRCIRAEDTVARIGGDEFTVLLSEISLAEDASIIARKIVEAVREPIIVADLTLAISASIGISIFPDDAIESEDLLKAADTAMYQAKALGKDNFHFFTQDLVTLTKQHESLNEELQSALANQQFELYYQPQLRLIDNKVVGLEALIRWNHPTRGLLAPKEFINVADESDMIDSITEWVISTALADHDKWSNHGKNGLRIAVNITGRQFGRESSITKIVNSLNDLSPPSHDFKLDLEISETEFEKISEAVKVINRLNKRDTVLSIDHFGTGHSSLSRLKETPVESLKIDQSFIRDLTSDKEDIGIVKAIISMGHSLGLRIVGEGVENLEQRNILDDLGCDEIQGFYISQPLPAEQIENILSQYDGKLQI